MLLDTSLLQFLTLAEELHFGRAANKLWMSQPALSGRIKDLEQRLGVQLLTRSSRRVELTSAGKLLAEQAPKLFDHAERILAMIKGSADIAHPLRVGYSPCVDFSWINARLFPARAESDQPPEIELVSRHSLEQVRLLEASKLDAGILLGPVGNSELRSELLFREPLAVALNCAHTFANRPAISLRELEGEPIVWLRRDLDMFAYDHLLEAWAAQKFNPNSVRQVTTIQECLHYVSEGLGISFLPQPAQGAQATFPVAFVDLAHSPLSLSVELVYRPGDNRSEKRDQFAAFLKEQCRDKGD